MHKRSRSTGPSALPFTGALLAVLVASGLVFDHSAGPEAASATATVLLDRELAREGWSPHVRQVATWSVSSQDHAGQPFVIIDQAQARLFAFTGQGSLAGSTRILPGAHDAPLPAGRYTADTWRSARAGTVVWADVDKGQSLQAMPAAAARDHVVSTVLAEGAGDASVEVADEFYRQHLRAFRSQESVLYVLPELMPLQRNLTRYASAPCRHPDPDNQSRTLS